MLFLLPCIILIRANADRKLRLMSAAKKIEKQNEKYALVTSYEPQELKELGISYSSTKKISLYDEILIHPDTSKIFE